MTELEKAWQNARSIESKEEHTRAAIIGRTQRGDRICVFYRDASGNYWYETRFWNGKEEISEEEHIFGRKLRNYSRRRR
jgi:hypothetical protein